MAVTILHNPRCSKSRKTLELLLESGAAHDVVLYLQEPPDASRILHIAALLKMSVADLLRRGEATFKEAEDLPDLDDNEALAAWLHDNPIVIERPIVIDDAANKAVIGRPPENVLQLINS